MTASHVRIAPRARSHVAVGLLLLAGALSLPLVVRAAEVVPLSLEETVRQADAIVVATVTGRQSRWGDQSQRWMVTDYTLAVENVLYPSEQGEPMTGSIVVTYWGGTIGTESQGISDLRLPIVGERLVMMLRPDWARRMEFSPVVGFNQGLFSVAAAAGAVERQTSTLLDADGHGLALAGGRIERGMTADASAPGVSLATFATWLASNVSRIKAEPSELRSLPLQGDNRPLSGGGKMPAFELPAGSRSSTIDSRTPSAAADASSQAIPNPGFSQMVVESSRPTLAQGSSEYVTLGPKPNLPIVVNNFPPSYAPWWPEDENQMAKWNYYASGVFRVYATPKSTFAWRDNVFDLDGWVDSSTLQSIYGSPWGSTTIGITFWRSSGNTLLEADIALNPAYSYTLDDESVYDGGTAQGFRLVMLHELGHMLGLDHNFGGSAVMNYFPSRFRFFAFPYMDDAAAIRALYPANAVAHTDLGVYLYYSSGTQSVSDASYPASAVAGGSLTVSNFTIENVGTTTIATPRINWYLTPVRNFNGAYYYLGETTYSPGLAPFQYYNPAQVQNTLTIPAGVPAGSYYLAAYIANDEGIAQATFPFSNNFAFSRLKVAVSMAPPPAPTLVSPANNSTSVSLNPGLIWNAASNASSYDIYFGTSTSPSFYANTASTSRTVGPLTAGTKYYWRVVALNSGGSSLSSSTFAFTTAAALPTPTLLSPANNATTVPRTAVLHWSASAGATSYDVYAGTTNPPVFYANITSTLISVGPLAASTGYFWNVVAKNGNSASSLSATFSFTTTAKPLIVHQLLRNTSTGDVSAWLMNGLAVTQAVPIFPALSLQWRIDGIGDLNGDHQTDLVFRNTATGDVAAWLMNGTAIAQATMVYSGLPAEWQIIGVADLDGDGKDDLIFRHAGTGDVAAWLMNGAVPKQVGLIYAGLPSNWQIDRLDDLDGDRRADLVFRNTQTGDVAGWLMNGFAIRQAETISAGLPLVWRIDGVGDLNADGRADLLFRNTQTGDVAGWLMNGLTPTQGAIIASGTPLAWRMDGVGDLNGDGKADLVFRNTQTGDVAGWLMNGLAPTLAGLISAGQPLAWQLQGIGDLDGNQ